MIKKIKAITIGDIDGIGIEILIKLWKVKRRDIGNFIIISNYNLFIKFLKKRKIKIPTKKLKNLENFSKECINVYNIEAKNSVSNTYNSIINAYNLCKNNQCSAMITLPVNKDLIIKKIDKSFIGQTELLQKLDKSKFSNMIFYSKKIITTTLTTHIPIKSISSKVININFIYNKILSIEKILKLDFKIEKPKIVLSGLNPHAGENSTIGNEEKISLIPAIKKLKKKHIDISGPFSGDSLFNKSNRGIYDCFICMYHDQALIPFKIINNHKGVNYTGSLSVIRTSPAHGTAYNLVGKDKANYGSLYESILLANKIYKNRNK